MKREIIAVVVLGIMLGGLNEYNNGRLTFNASNGLSYSPSFSGLAEGVVDTPTEWEEAMKNAIYNLEDEVNITIIDYNEEDYNLENIGINEVGIDGEYSQYGKRTDMKCTFDYQDNYKIMRAEEDSALIYKLNENQKQTLATLKGIVLSIITEDMSDYQKEVAIHDYIVKNYKYDYENFSNGTVPESSYQITGLVSTKTGVCNAYAYTFQVMCKMAGLDTMVIRGDYEGEKHAWNLIQLDDEYYHVDITSDDPVPDRGDEVRYDYFNISDEIASIDHSWEREEYPQCLGEKYNYYEYNSMVVTDYGTLASLIRTDLSGGSNKVNFYSYGYTIESIDLFYVFAREFGYKYIEVIGNIGGDGAFTVTFN